MFTKQYNMTYFIIIKITDRVQYHYEEPNGFRFLRLPAHLKQHNSIINLLTNVYYHNTPRRNGR